MWLGGLSIVSLFCATASLRRRAVVLDERRGCRDAPIANAHATIETIECNFGNVLRIQPPLVITEKQLETVAATTMDGIKAFAAR